VSPQYNWSWVAGSIPSDFKLYQVGGGFNSKRLQTSVEGSTLSDSKFEQVGNGCKYEDQHNLSVVTSASILFVNRNVGINLTAFFKMSGRGGRKNGRGGRGAHIVEDAVEDETRMIMARPMQQIEVFVPISAQMCLTTVRSLQ
jgi:hypothetical protein